MKYTTIIIFKHTQKYHQLYNLWDLYQAEDIKIQGILKKDLLHFLYSPVDKKESGLNLGSSLEKHELVLHNKLF